MSHPDLIEHLAGIAAGSPLASARATRDAATRHSQGSYAALFIEPDETVLPAAVRLELARLTANLHADAVLEQHYAQLLATVGAPGDSAWLQLGVEHARRLALQPVQTTAAHLQALLDGGWSETAIVVLSQIVTFVSYQSRVITGLRLIDGQGPVAAEAVAASDWHRHERTHSGKRAPVAYTQEQLQWEAWIAPLAVDELSEEAAAALNEWKVKAADYLRLLARDFKVMRERRLADHGIFFASGGLPRAERELAAAVTSKINGCIYCASVHARRTSQLSKRVDDVQRLLDVQPGGTLSADQDERWQALIDFSASLAATPPRAGGEQISRLRALGLDELQLLDLVQAVAFFSWANRLMLSLGEAYWPAE